MGSEDSADSALEAKRVLRLTRGVNVLTFKLTRGVKHVKPLVLPSLSLSTMHERLSS